MKKFIPVFLILVLGLILRVYNLSDRPLGFTWDEAAIGYNAHSLLNSGRDEHGQIFPVVFKSFGDYKPGLYIYHAVPSVAILGLNEFSTRLPSAVSGTLLILLVYLLVRHLFADNRSAAFSALALAINPWAIHFSRGAWEANFALFLTTLGTVLFVRGRYLLASIFFGLTFWTYQGSKLFTPLIILSLLLVFRPQINLKSKIISLVLLLLLLAPILAGLSTQSGRLKVFSVFSYTRQKATVTEILRQDNTPSMNFIYYLFHSEKLDQFRGVANRYLNYFSPRFLFIEGNWSDLRQQAAPFYGNFHLGEILTLIIGLALLLKTNRKPSLFILAWLVLAPIPAALSRDIITSVRSLPLVLPLSIASGFGLAWLFKYHRLRLVLVLALIGSLVYFLDLYFVHAPKYSAAEWLSAYKPAMQILNQQGHNYSRIVFTQKLGQPYIFVLFYGLADYKYSSSDIIRIDSPRGDVGQVLEMGKFTFRPIYWPADRGLSSTLFVGDIFELPPQDLDSTTNLVNLGTVTYPNGSPGLTIVGLP